MGYGPVILGHGDPRVDDYVNERMRKGVSFSLTSEDEIRTIELINELTGWVDMARMTVSGTEATMHLMRLARAYTGRERIVKFEGQYHGVHDYALISVGPDDMSELGDPDAPVALAWGRGIPSAVADTIIPARYNRIERLRQLFEERGEEIAAIIVEPVLGQRPGHPARGGLPPADARADRGVRDPPDLRRGQDRVPVRRGRRGRVLRRSSRTSHRSPRRWATAIPAAAFGGRREIMELLPDKVSHGGTYAGNRVAAAAAVATLQIIRDTNALETIHATGRTIQDGIKEILDPVGIPYHFTGHPSMFGMMFREEVPTEYRDWATSDHELYDAIAIGMHARGAMPEPDSREPWFICEAHADADIIDRVLTAFEESLDVALEERARAGLHVTPHGGMASPAAG